ncbi:2OG-Fe(II) oxygenase [Chryseolinea sp. H1M3-3]|uniref:2OG-Fe(II) oxygenase n=1 Tax=Chryseolinea sp. H1M3-3 TaxID=3034144 RepID=UPI0023EB4B3E|nr:2OG-Fe(II) oxygenase [Chryseolinea sp. H1M3-3]
MVSELNKVSVITIGAALVLRKFAELSNAKISFNNILNAIESHYDGKGFSMLEIDKILKNWGFDTFAARIKEEALDQIDFPVISHIIENDEEEFVLLTNYQDGIVSFIEPGSMEKHESLSEFRNKWQGIVLMADAQEGIVENDFENKQTEHEKVKNNFIKTKMKFVDNFFSDEECDQLIQISKSEMKRSLVTNGYHSAVSNRRTSYSATLRDMDQTLKDNIRLKSTQLLGDLPFEKFEEFQCVSYDKYQEFKAHFDAGKGMKRPYTILVYLNENFDGGETYFPLLDLVVKPKKGKAIMFHNLEPDESINIYSFHAGLKVENGIKFACNIWVR